MILIKLFFAFFQVGLFAFGGGYAILPFIQDIIVEEHGWLTMAEMTDVVTISQMTPGPIALNAATFVGTKVAGLAGSIVATLGTIIPQFAIMILLGFLVFGDKKISLLDRAIAGLKPGIVGLIAVASLTMAHSSLFGGLDLSLLNLNYIALVTFIVGFILTLKKVDIVKIIILGGLMGLILQFII